MKKSFKTLLFTYACLAVCFFYTMVASAQVDTLAVNNTVSLGLPVVGAVINQINPLWGQIFGLLAIVILPIIRAIERSKAKKKVSDTVKLVTKDSSNNLSEKHTDILNTLTK